jgi:LmbE family N-acetylglucosaminyl deacetylase
MPGSPDNEHPRALAAAPVEEVAAKVTHYIRRLHPQVVITHDPIGGYKHPDHIAVHQATVNAFHAASDPQSYPSDLPPHTPQKLYFHTFSIPLIRPLMRLLPLLGINPRAVGRNKDIDLEELFSQEPFPIHAVINYRRVADLKEAASACHASQLEGGPGQFKILSWAFRLIGNKDQYMRAHPPFVGRQREKDLFNGLDLMV